MINYHCHPGVVEGVPRRRADDCEAHSAEQVRVIKSKIGQQFIRRDVHSEVEEDGNLRRVPDVTMSRESTRVGEVGVPDQRSGATEAMIGIRDGFEEFCFDTVR